MNTASHLGQQKTKGPDVSDSSTHRSAASPIRPHPQHFPREQILSSPSNELPVFLPHHTHILSSPLRPPKAKATQPESPQISLLFPGDVPTPAAPAQIGVPRAATLPLPCPAPAPRSPVPSPAPDPRHSAPRGIRPTVPLVLILFGGAVVWRARARERVCVCVNSRWVEHGGGFEEAGHPLAKP